MATERRRTDRSVAERLESEPYRFDFYQAVSLIERMRPAAASVGTGVDATKEAVHFTSASGLDFPASDIATISGPETKNGAWRMRVAFLGLGGVQGPLPHAYVERLLSRKTRNIALRDFLDIFHHRLVALMYRVRRKQRIGIDGHPPESSTVAPMLTALAGLGTKGLENRLAVPDRNVLRYAALLSQRPRSAVGLEKMLSSYFAVPVRVRQFVGRWHSIEPDDVTRIGAQGQANVLGESAVLGTRVWDQQGRIALVVGPMDYDRFRDLLPPGTALAAFRGMTSLYLGPEMEFSVQLVLRARQVPAAALDPVSPPMLGWTSWLGSARPRTHNPHVSIAGSAS